MSAVGGSGKLHEMWRGKSAAANPPPGTPRDGAKSPTPLPAQGANAKAPLRSPLSNTPSSAASTTALAPSTSSNASSTASPGKAFWAAQMKSSSSSSPSAAAPTSPPAQTKAESVAARFQKQLDQQRQEAKTPKARASGVATDTSSGATAALAAFGIRPKSAGHPRPGPDAGAEAIEAAAAAAAASVAAAKDREKAAESPEEEEEKEEEEEEEFNWDAATADDPSAALAEEPKTMEELREEARQAAILAKQAEELTCPPVTLALRFALPPALGELDLSGPGRTSTHYRRFPSVFETNKGMRTDSIVTLFICPEIVFLANEINPNDFMLVHQPYPRPQVKATVPRGKAYAKGTFLKIVLGEGSKEEDFTLMTSAPDETQYWLDLLNNHAGQGTS